MESAGLGMMGVPGGHPPPPAPPGGPIYVPGDDEEYGIVFPLLGLGHGLPAPAPLYRETEQFLFFYFAKNIKQVSCR